MERLVRSITDHFIKKLPDHQNYFTPADLRALKIPEFLVRRIEAEMFRNLNESFVPPHSDWADMSADSVQEAWQQFTDAIVEEVRMPASFAKTVMETSVGDVLEVIVKPRVAIPDIIFGNKNELSSEELTKQIKFITVNGYLSSAVVRYMERKNKDSITREQCEKVIAKVDKGLTSTYNPLNWAQLLEPLFVLTGPSVDSNLFRLFFEDKGLNRPARRFDMIDHSLNKTEFIEVMSSPDLLRDEGYEEDQSSLFEISQKADIEEAEEPKIESKNEVLDEIDKIEFDFDFKVPKIDESGLIDSDTDTSSKEESDFNEDDEDDDSIISSFHQKVRKKKPSPSDEIENRNEDEEKEKESPLHRRFTLDEDELGEIDEMPIFYPETGEEPERERTAESKENKKTETTDESEEDIFTETDLSEESVPLAKRYGSDIDDDEDDEDEKEMSESEDDEDSPIWQSFLGKEEEDLKDKVDEDRFIDDPIIDLTKENPEVNHDFKELLNWLGDDKERFVEQIFSGSESAFEEALSELSEFDEWKKTAKYIEKEIFSRNLVDMYDEVAVDFTDRLQSYFIEYKSSKN